MPVDHTYLQYNKVLDSTKKYQFHVSKVSGNSDLNIDASNLVIDASHISINNMLVFDLTNKRINPAPPNNNGLINLGYKNTSSDRARFNEVHLKELFTTKINNYLRYRLYSDPTYSSDPFIIYSDQNGSSKFFSIDISGISTFGNNLIVNGDISATTFYGDGSNLTGIDALPSQSGNAGKLLTTDGSTASWSNNIVIDASHISINNDIDLSGNIIPTINETFDLGTPEFRFRDLFLSNASIWFGDNNKISINSDGKFSSKKRKTNIIPAFIRNHQNGHSNISDLLN